MLPSKYNLPFLLIIVFLSCTKQSPIVVVVPSILPEITTLKDTLVTSTSAKCGGTIISQGSYPIISRGVCWSMNQNPTIADYKTNDGTGIGTFTSNITGLTPEITYYIRAYATSKAGTSYGIQVVEDYVINDGKNIRFVFDDGLNDNPTYRLPKDNHGFYYYYLYAQGQNIQRISGRLLDGQKVVYCAADGYAHNLTWSSNLYWWLLQGQTIANITKTYFNPYTGRIQYVNLPNLVNWQNALVPTINKSSMTNELTGAASTLIAPLGNMKGDTMVIYTQYNHLITRKQKGSWFFESLGTKTITDSVKIILK